MNFEKIERNGKQIAVVRNEDKVITDTQSAIDLLMMAKYDAGTKLLAVSKELICSEFFILSSGVAGEILQKYINYEGKLAIYGDFSKYTSKPLRDFIYESNNGHDFFFVATEDDAVDMLTR
jgi:hypothetical protein